MNSQYSWFFDHNLAGGPLTGIVVRISLLLAIAWLAHLALTKGNPRWRVLAWRIVAVAVVLVLAVTFCGPAISLKILPAQTPIQGVPLVEVPPDFAIDPRPLPSELVGRPEARATSDSVVPVVTLPPREPDTSPTSGQIDWLWLGLAIWTMGAAIGLSCDCFAWWKLRALRHRSQPVDSDITLLGGTIAARLGFHQSFEIRRTRDLNSPCVFGVLRPVVLIPNTDCGREQRDALSAILSHEIAHLVGDDVRWHGLLRGLTRLLWFHPLIWRVRAAHLTACDAVCDATAANYIGDAVGYGRILAQMALRVARTNTGLALQMARRSNVRCRIEALQRRLYSSGLSRTAVTAAMAASLLLAGLCGVASIDRVTAAPTKEAGLTITGRILNEQAQPINGATVYVYSAGVRLGTSPYYPTCYLDCGKRATTGADGRFVIPNLDSTLIFQLLAVADGHRPQFIKKVDPQDGANIEAKLAVRLIPKEPDRVVRGQVINPQGKPEVGAVVEPFGCKTTDRRWWGQMDGVDPLVVTDARGEFVIVCDSPIISLHLKVEARGAARKNFELVKSGAEKHRLVLEAGTMVTGRVLDQGRPLRGISIGICQADRSAGKFLGPYQVDTDEEGKFALANLPSEEDLLAYGIMKSLKGEKALPVRKFRTANGSTTDLGDLMIAPAHSIRGRLALADGQPIPPHTRVMFSREEAWDSSFVEAAADGTFWIGGIPKEIIEVFVGINGYRLSAKNKSFEPLNGSSIKGHVSADVEDLVILYEQGKEIPSDDRNWEAAAEKHERLRTQPLAGVTAALAEFPPEKINAAVPGPRKPLPKIAVPEREPVPASAQNGAPTVTLTGKVVDHQGQQVDKAKLWLPVRWLSPFEWLIAKGSYDAPDPFRLTYPEAWVPTNIMDRNPTVWAYAPKHAIGTRSAHKQLFGKKPAEPFEIALPEAGDLTFVVMLPDGKPAVGAKVQPLHFKTSRGYDHIPRELAELVAGTTDTNGRAALPALTRDGVHTIDVKLAGFGTQQFRCDMKLTDPPEQTLKLRPTGRIEGRIATDQLDLVRGMYVSLETEGLEPDNDLREATGVALLKVDDEGRFVVPEIAAGHVEVFASGDKRLPVRARLPKRGALTLLEKETETIEIPLEMGVRVHGIVRAKDSQKPLAGVTLSVRYGVGIQGDQAVTDEKGEYSTIALAGETYVHLIALPAGYQQLGAPWDERRTVPSDAQEYEWPLIEVVPSTKIFGKLINRDGKPMARVSINGVVGNRRYGSGKTDETGVFTLTDVPEGIQLEKFEIWTRDEHFEGVIETKEPLVVQVKK